MPDRHPPPPDLTAGERESAMERALRSFGLIGPRDKLVRVRSWRPAVYRYRGRLEVSWPTLLIDAYGHSRCCVSPVWNRARLVDVGRRFAGGKP